MPMSNSLPNGWSVRYSTCPMYDAQKQHTEFGIDPDIPAALNDESTAKGIDPIIETARKYLANDTSELVSMTAFIEHLAYIVWLNI